MEQMVGKNLKVLYRNHGSQAAELWSVERARGGVHQCR
jgi:hypothetical protein